MVFRTPTTKGELKEVLKEIYDHYRNQKDQFEEVVLEDLALEKINFTPKTDKELTNLATDFYQHIHLDEKKQRRENIESSISSLNNEKASLTIQVEKLKEDLEKRYEVLKEEAEENAIKRGLINSTVILNKISDLEKEKINKLADIDFEFALKSSSIDEKITGLTIDLNEIDDFFTLKHADDIKKKKAELKEKDEEKNLEELKYNNQVEEKLVKYSNTLKRTRQELYLEYLKIKAQGLTDEELIASGYYSAVIKACNAYYYTISPNDAYSDFLNDEDMPIYLGCFYSNLLTLYTSRLA
ncbi:MAG: hypothetical protein E7342_00175 [Clostridiales bacterium]|nr:hypothetical protein [Clostridiales bacterium]